MEKFGLLLGFLFFFSVLSSQSFRDSINVHNYDIKLSILDFSKKTIEGSTSITFSPIFDNTQIVKFDLLKLSVDKIFLDDKKYKNWVYNDTIITIILKNAVNSDDRLKLEVFYSGKPQQDDYWGGFYFSNRDAYNMGVGMASVPPCFGRVWYPCIDNFTDKATYNYSITVDSRYKAVCGGNLISVTENKMGNKTYNWVLEREIPTYLSSVVIADYELIEDVYEGVERKIPIEIHTYAGKKSLTKKSFVNLKEVMKIYEELFGPYQWGKIGFSEVSFSGGAMEHAENSAISQYAFNGNLNQETLLYHELAHSWFGNLVTCASAEDMWLNEGWAKYCEAIYIEKLYGFKDYLDFNRKRHFEVVHTAHKRDGDYLPLSPIPAEYTYGITVYRKGANVVHTLRNYMGDGLFFPAVRSYLMKYAFGNATTKDLKHTLAEHSGINLDDFFDFWVYTKGFAFFEIVDYKTVPKDENFEAFVTVEQRLLEADKYANSNKIEISFVDSDLNIENRIFEFSGKMGKQSFILPFEPVAVLLDMNEKTADATIDKFVFVEETGDYVFNECFFDAEVSSVKSKSLLRVVCNCIKPSGDDMPGYLSVSYTHLTLPTKRIV